MQQNLYPGSIGIPSEKELNKNSRLNGTTVYVKEYVRSDGVKVKGHYRSI